MPSFNNPAIQTRHGLVALTDTGQDGLPIVFLHGSGSSRQVFQRQMTDPRLAEFRLISIDLPGHGDSEDAIEPADAYTSVGLADAVADVITALRIDRYVLCGWSLGGHVAIEMMGRFDGIAGAVLAGAPPVSKGILGMLRGFHPSFDLFLASKQSFSARDIDRFLSLCFADAALPSFRSALVRADGRLRAIFSNAMMKGKGEDQRRVIEQVDVPIAFINGSHDPFIRSSYLSTLHVPMLFRQQPQVIESAGHAPFWETPDAFNALLESFLEDVQRNEIARLKALRHAAG